MAVHYQPKCDGGRAMSTLTVPQCPQCLQALHYQTERRYKTRDGYITFHAWLCYECGDGLLPKSFLFLRDMYRQPLSDNRPSARLVIADTGNDDQHTPPLLGVIA